MKYILIAISQTDPTESNASTVWFSLKQSLQPKIRSRKGIEILPESVFLIPSESGLPVLGYAIAAAEDRKLSYRVMFINDFTEWKNKK